MKKSNSSNRVGQGIIKHIAAGALLALASSLLLSVIVTMLVEKGYIAMGSTSIPIFVTHAISVFSGATLAIRIEKGRTAIVSGVVSAVYWLILLCVNMLIFTEGIEGVAFCCVAVTVGCLMAIGVNLHIGVKRKPTKKKHSR